MKTEFLQTLKVNGQPLPKDVIDAILAENGKDIEAAKKPYLDYDTIKQQLKDAQTTLQGIQDQGTDLETARKNAQDWEKKYNPDASEGLRYEGLPSAAGDCYHWR